jgi:predicted thioesterase
MLSTPALILELQRTARSAIAGGHPDSDASVGTFLEIEHVAPAPAGARVRCSARVIHIDGPVISFAIDAHDDVERIAQGLRRRRIGLKLRFARRLDAKWPS